MVLLLLIIFSQGGAMEHSLELKQHPWTEERKNEWLKSAHNSRSPEATRTILSSEEGRAADPQKPSNLQNETPLQWNFPTQGAGATVFIDDTACLTDNWGGNLNVINCDKGTNKLAGKVGNWWGNGCCLQQTSASDNGYVALCDLTEINRITILATYPSQVSIAATLQYQTETPSLSGFNCVAGNKDLFFSGRGKGQVALWSVARARLLNFWYSIQEPDSIYNAIASTANGEQAAAAYNEGKIGLFDSKTSNPVGYVPIEKNWPWVLTYDKTENYLAYGDMMGENSNISIYDLRTMKLFQTLEDKSEEGTANLQFKGNNELISVGWNSIITKWNLETKAKISSQKLPIKDPLRVAFSPGAEWYVAGGQCDIVAGKIE